MPTYSALNRTETGELKQIDFDAPGDFQAMEYMEKTLGKGWTLWRIL